MSREKKPGKLRLISPDREDVFIEISKEERERIRKKIKELGGNIETRRGITRFKEGGAMPKIYLSSLINQRLERP